jgi:hypothetical protein
MWTSLLDPHRLLGAMAANVMLLTLFYSPIVMLSATDASVVLWDTEFSPVNCGAQHSCVEREKKCHFTLNER